MSYKLLTKLTIITIITNLTLLMIPAYAADKGAAPVAHCEYEYSSSDRASPQCSQSREVFMRFSTELAHRAIVSARTVLDGISDFFVTPAYAADKGAAPVAHWRFDEGGGPTAYDDSTNNNDGTLNAGTLGSNTAVGQMWTAQGKIGAALECDGTDDYVSVGDKSDWAFGTNPFTITLWAKWNSLANIESIIGQSTGPGNVAKWALVQNMNTSYAYDSTKLTFMVYNAGESFAVWNWTPATGTWYHIAITRSGTSFKLYVNGVQTGGTQTVTVTVPDVATDLRIGSDGEAWNFFNGLIDDVRIYNYARTAAQILVDYNAGSAAHLGAGTDPNEGTAPVGIGTSTRTQTRLRMIGVEQAIMPRYRARLLGLIQLNMEVQ
jgi:hypothetical protein